ncbi:MAG TPA: hypothetical protein VMX18_03335 [Candidatus Bipolaricaulota bacterium]|nr:hypothetical protein [Candidatus Bipolaricaulota bacterium]
MKKTFIILGLVSILFFGFVGESFAVTVMPPVLEGIVVEPGKVYEGSYRIRNETDSPRIYYFMARNFDARGEEGDAGLASEEDSQMGLASWVEFEFPFMLVMVGETKEINFKIKVPSDAEPGGHYAALFTSTEPPGSEQSGGVGLGENTGVLTLVTVPGNIRQGADLVEFSLASGKKVFNRPPVEFLIRIKNSGNVHFKPIGDISVSGWIGASALIAANPKKGNILPNSIRAFHPIWRGPEERGSFVQELKNEWHNFGFGRYTAHLEMAWQDDPDEKIIGNLKFWIIPWHLMLVGLAILAILYLMLRSYNKAIIKMAQKKNEIKEEVEKK